MNNDKSERRAAMLAKVRKLLNMARDGRGNATEEETAMRQANKIMAEYGIAEAECDMTAINAGEMVYGQIMVGPDGKDLKDGKVYKSSPTWAGVLGVGVARFTDTVIIRKTTAHGDVFVFQGEKEDVLLARWIFGVLIESIQAEQKRSGWTSRGDANSFRTAAASALQNRLKDLAKERMAMYQQAVQSSASMALVVVDRKQAEIAKRFGVQRTKSARSSYSSSGAAMAGSSAASRINIPSGRPLTGSTQARLSS